MFGSELPYMSVDGIRVRRDKTVVKMDGDRLFLESFLQCGKFGVPEATRTENFKTEEVISCVKGVSKRDGHCFKATQ